MIKVLKSTLKSEFYGQNVLCLQINEIMMSPDLMDALNIMECEIVELSSSSGTSNAYITTGKEEGDNLLFGGFVSGNVIISSYKYMDQESALLNKPIRLVKFSE